MFQIQVDRIKGNRVFHKNQSYTYFGGTAYLGIPHNHTFQRYLAEGLHRYGSNYGSSRGGNILPSVYPEAEKILANTFQMDGAISFSSGYLAAQTLVQYLASKTQSFIQLNQGHPSLFHSPIQNSSSLYYPENFEEETVLDKIHSKGDQEWVLTSTSLNPLTGKVYSFDWLKNIERKIRILLDDSHGLGVLGKDGRGILSRIPENEKLEVYIVSSLGKALGIPGGLILGPQTAIQQIQEMPVFLSSSPISPAYLYAFIRFQNEYSKQRDRLEKIRNLFQKRSRSWLNPVPDHPVISLSGPEFNAPEKKSKEPIFDFLLKRGILASSFSYPRPEDRPLTRLVLNASHSEKDIKYLAQSLEEWIF